MGGCSAPNCQNGESKGFKMFYFPSKLDRQEVWFKNIRRADWDWYP